MSMSEVVNSIECEMFDKATRGERRDKRRRNRKRMVEKTICGK